MKITVIGSGYVGLVVGACLADTGHKVKCVDLDAKRVEGLNRAEIPIYEPGLEELVARNIEEERISFTTDLVSAVEDCLIVFLCVGTPPQEGNELDTSAVMGAVEQIARAMTGYRIIVSKSTCPVGTTRRIAEKMREITSHPFDVVSNPEFLKEGAAIDDFMRPDRIVIGCDDVRVAEIMKELYAPFVRTGKPLLTMGFESAEISKLSMNCMLATRISTVNELAGLCERCGADMSSVREVLANDTRIGSAYLFAGLGYGGSCLPKDIRATATYAKALGLKPFMLDAATEVNEYVIKRFIDRMMGYYKGELKGKKIAVWGAAFKPRTDDLRGAPALRVINGLLEAGASVSVYDPAAGEGVKAIYGDKVEIARKCYDALQDADGLVIATEWNEFRRPDYDRMGELMRDKVIFDGRSIYTPSVLAEKGFAYFSIGRG